MVQTADVVVVGGGVNGGSIAYALAAKGTKVALVENAASIGIDGLYLATAFSGSGFKIAPAVGICLAELITEGHAKTVDIEVFALERFATGRVVEGPYPYALRPDHVDPTPSRSA